MDPHESTNSTEEHAAGNSSADTAQLISEGASTSNFVHGTQKSVHFEVNYTQFIEYL